MTLFFYTELSTSHKSYKLAGVHPSFCLAKRISFNIKDFFITIQKVLIASGQWESTFVKENKFKIQGKVAVQ